MPALQTKTPDLWAGHFEHVDEGTPYLESMRIYGATVSLLFLALIKLPFIELSRHPPERPSRRLPHRSLCSPSWREHKELWGSLITGRLYKVSGQTKQGCETPSIAEPHPIQTRAD
jgi:hypothetical protein